MDFWARGGDVSTSLLFLGTRRATSRRDKRKKSHKRLSKGLLWGGSVKSMRKFMSISSKKKTRNTKERRNTVKEG